MPMHNGLPYAEFRFKRNWTTKRGGWVQGKSEVTEVWYPLVYVNSLRAADRYVNKIMKRREEPDTFVSLPLIKAHD